MPTSSKKCCHKTHNTRIVGALHATPDVDVVGATLVVAQNNNVATNNRATTRVAPTTVDDIVGAFQPIVTVDYIRAVKNFGWRMAYMAAVGSYSLVSMTGMCIVCGESPHGT